MTAEPDMTRADKLLILLLRLFGGSALLALVAVFMPMSWMIGIHRWLGLGDMPTTPIVEYLARSLSAFYVFFGAFCLMLTTDLERYRSLVRFLALCLIVLGAINTGIDLVAGLPWWWSAMEGPPVIGIGGWIYYLARGK